MKRIFDVIVALFLILLMLPLMGVISLLIAVNMGVPVVFRQKRPGLHNRIFTMYKFRSMRNDVGQDGKLLPDAERLTHLGRILRSTSIDELPELFNVLKGDMSLVGPRPLLVEYLEKYTPDQLRRHSVLPGLTGYAQIHGRQLISFSKRLELDLWYVDHRSLWLDLKIILFTIPCVMISHGVLSGQDVSEVDDLGLSSSGSKVKK